MHLATFEYEGRTRLGVKVDDDHLVDLAEAAAADGKGAAPADMSALIEGGEAALKRVRDLLTFAAGGKVRRIPLDKITWLPPQPKPGKILGVAMNNSASDARKISAPNHPMFFMKPRTCLLGHKQDIEVRPYYGGLHPEPELGVIVGKRGKDLDPAKAMEWVFGYTILNDMTGNAMRAQDMVHYWALYADPADPTTTEKREQHLSYAARYKGTDGFGPCGPWLVTKDAIADPHDLEVVCKCGDDVVAEDSTKYLTYGVPEIMAFISRFMTLEPGDLISMGTAFRPAAGAKRSLHTADMQRFDGPLSVTISGIGTLINGVKRTDPVLPDWRLKK